MRKVSSISRETILKAIRTEPLGHQGWVRNQHLRERGNCTVCAVGAVMRTVGLPNHLIHHAASGNAFSPVGEDYQIASILEDKDYLGALSSYFESLPHSLRGKRLRDRLVKFVKENLPRRIQLQNPLFVPSQQDIDRDARLGATA